MFYLFFSLFSDTDWRATHTAENISRLKTIYILNSNIILYIYSCCICVSHLHPCLATYIHLLTCCFGSLRAIERGTDNPPRVRDKRREFRHIEVLHAQPDARYERIHRPQPPLRLSVLDVTACCVVWQLCSFVVITAELLQESSSTWIFGVVLSRIFRRSYWVPGWVLHNTGTGMSCKPSTVHTFSASTADHSLALNSSRAYHLKYVCTYLS